jgi:hypothetical protein
LPNGFSSNETFAEMLTSRLFEGGVLIS